MGASEQLQGQAADAAVVASAGEDLYFASVVEAKRLLEGLDLRPGSGVYYRAVALYVLDPANQVSGDPVDYFNLLCSYAAFGDYHMMYLLALKALELYPYDADILSRAIRAAVNCSAFDNCAGLLEQAARIPKNAWTDRLFVEVAYYYETLLKVCDQARRGEVLDAALELTHTYQRYFPADERAYDREAVILLADGRVDEAQRVLERAVFGMVELPNGEQASLVAPQCCITLLDRVLGGSTDYKLIARVARRGVRNTTQEQPGASIGYFVYREALALDAIVCDADDDREGFRNVERVREALVTYRCAYRLLKGRAYCSTIRDRYTLLCLKSGIADLPLEDPDGAE
jgi:tetratricopeptide (TPR) repeat protein